LKEHAKRIGAKSPNWHFLTGDRDYIGKLADQFNIYVGDKEDESESLNHSGMIALVDKKEISVADTIKIICRFFIIQD
jgi:protein SCO1/2